MEAERHRRTSSKLSLQLRKDYDSSIHQSQTKQPPQFGSSNPFLSHSAERLGKSPSSVVTAQVYQQLSNHKQLKQKHNAASAPRVKPNLNITNSISKQSLYKGLPKGGEPSSTQNLVSDGQAYH